MISRRNFLRTGALVAAGAAAATAVDTATTSDPAQAGFFDEFKYRFLVPELYNPVPDAPAYSPVVVIGTGFGGAVAAYRIAQAGLAVTVLERGSRWPVSPWRATFSPDSLPDGRAFWHRTSFTGVTGIPVHTDDFGGVLDVTDFDGISVWRGAAVGGGSIVYTGAHPTPDKQWFDASFRGRPTYEEMISTWYPRAKSVLRVSPMPDDVYGGQAFTHSRTWDAQSIKAGYRPQIIDGIWNWNTVRAETTFGARPSATIGESNYGNADGAKFDLTQNYLKYAEQTGRATIYQRHTVTAIGRDARSGRYLVAVRKTDAAGRVLSSRTIACDRLFLAGGSIGTTELLMRARATGALPDLNEYVGTGWGNNGDAAVARTFNVGGFTQGAPSRSRIVDAGGAVPVALENWFVPGLPIDIGVIGSLAMTLDPTRADFTFDTGADRLRMTWPGQPASFGAIRAMNSRIAAANNVTPGVGSIAPDVNMTFTAHPLGGAVLGRATDAYGRVAGYPGLYVIDGALVPGSTGLTNPSLTITALAERNIARIIADAG